MIAHATKGKTRADAIRLVAYLVLPKAGDALYQKGERLLGPPEMELCSALFPPQIDPPSARKFAEEFADQLCGWTQRMRAGKPMPKHLFEHASISFHPNDKDKLSGGLAEKIVNEIVDEVMPGERPKLKVAHGDTDHLHWHFLLGIVDAEGRIWNPRFDYRLWEMACERAEIKYGLHRVTVRKACAEQAPERMPQEKAVAGKELQGIIRTGQLTGKARVQQALRESLNGEITFIDFVASMEQKGVEILLNVAASGHVSGVSFRCQGSTYKGSTLGKIYGWKALSKKTQFDAIRDRETLERLKKKDQERRQNPASLSVFEMAQEPARKRRRTLDLAFEVVENVYRWRNSKRTAFTDWGNHISLESTNKTAIRAALQLAVGKGWSVIKLTGDEEFRRDAWEIAQGMGIQTVGYDPPPSGTGDGSPGNPQQKGPEYESEPEPAPEQNRPAKRDRQGGDPGDEYGDQYAAENSYER